MSFVWDGSLAVGHDGIDSDHEHLILLAARAEAAVVDKKDDITIAEVFVDLAEYTMSHFQREEQFMLRSHYPKLAEHKAMHDTLLSELSMLIDRAELHPGEIDQEVVAFLHHWVKDHIMTWDQALANHLSEQGYAEAV